MRQARVQPVQTANLVSFMTYHDFTLALTTDSVMTINLFVYCSRIVYIPARHLCRCESEQTLGARYVVRPTSPPQAHSWRAEGPVPYSPAAQANRCSHLSPASRARHFSSFTSLQLRRQAPSTSTTLPQPSFRPILNHLGQPPP